MKVLLIKDVKGSGRAGEIVEVSDGYARNYLFPRGLAKEASAEALNAVKIKKQAEQHRKEVEADEAKALAGRIQGLKVTLKCKTGEKGRLFGAITAKEIADALLEQHGINIDKRKLLISEPIKSLGTFMVGVRVYEKTDAKFQVEITPYGD